MRATQRMHLAPSNAVPVTRRRFNASVLESVRGLAPELWFAALGVSMPPALTLPLTCNAAGLANRERADCGSHGAPLKTCVLHLNRPHEDRCA